MLRWRAITDTFPSNRQNHQFLARVLAVSPKDISNPKTPMKLVVSQEDTCFAIALWGFDASTEQHLKDNLGNVFHFFGVDIKRQPEMCAATNPYGGAMSRMPRTGNIHTGDLRLVPTTNEVYGTFLKREYRFAEVPGVLPVLELPLPEETPTPPKRRCLNGCRQTLADAFEVCIFTGEPHEDLELPPSAIPASNACVKCGFMPGPDYIFCPVEESLIVHPGCEELADDFFKLLPGGKVSITH